jgi:hypothetical protein
VGCGVTPDGWGDPIHVVDHMMGWASAETRNFVQGLVDRKLVDLVWTGRDGQMNDPKSYWKQRDAYSN